MSSRQAKPGQLSAPRQPLDECGEAPRHGIVIHASQVPDAAKLECDVIEWQQRRTNVLFSHANGRHNDRNKSDHSGPLLKGYTAKGRSPETSRLNLVAKTQPLAGQSRRQAASSMDVASYLSRRRKLARLASSKSIRLIDSGPVPQLWHLTRGIISPNVGS